MATLERDLNTRTLDHIVHLTPPGTVDEVSEKFKNLGFIVIPGGTHADGLTANVLVILADGVYLELISFVYPLSHYPEGSPEHTKRGSHRWARKVPGWIDFAFLGTGSHTESISEAINRRSERAGSGVSYLPEVDGGRVRHDGQVLKWLISSAKGLENIGRLPFFCGDVTSRDLRVPLDPPSNTEHPSTVIGVAFVRVLASSHSFPETVERLTTVIGRQPNSSVPDKSRWALDTPVVDQTDKPRRLELIVQKPESLEEHRFVEALNGDAGDGIYEVAFWVRETEGEGSTPYGKVKWIRF